MSDLPAITAEDNALAGHVRASFRQLSGAFDRARATARLPPDPTLEALVPSAAPPEERVRLAFAIARRDGWLSDLCEQCILDRIVLRLFVPEANKQIVLAGAQPGDVIVALQGLIDPASGLPEPFVEGPGLMTVGRQVCRIEIDGEFKGTGFLVRPNVIVTAGHVIEPPAGADALLDENGKALPGSGARISIGSDRRVALRSGGFTRPRFAFEVPPDDWLLAREAPAGGGGVAVPGTLLDYALIRLDAAPIADLAGLSRSNVEPFRDDRIIVFQHPRGQPIRYHSGTVDEVCGQDKRFFHLVNAQDGSSGGPCVDTRFNVVGIHQGEFRPGGGGDQKKRNIATLFSAVLAEVGPRLDVPVTFRRLTECMVGKDLRWPIIARTETQDWLRQSSLAGQQRILALTRPEMPGVERARKVGMTFTKDIMRAFLPPAQHVVLHLSADKFQNDAPERFAAERLLPELADDLPTLPTWQQDETYVKWLEISLVPETLQRMNAARRDRLVWIVLDDLHIPLSDKTGIREFLDLLYSQVAFAPWLRFVLLDYGATLPEAVRPFLTQLELPLIGEGDAEAFLEANILPDVDLPAEQKAGLRQSVNDILSAFRQLDLPERLGKMASMLSLITITMRR